jgi:hypothetical protein
MTVLRSDIVRALDDMISNEEGMRFQALAVVLAKQRWPEFIACERKKDLGADAIATASLTADRRGKVLACSLTATLEKIKNRTAGSQIFVCGWISCAFWCSRSRIRANSHTWRASSAAILMAAYSSREETPAFVVRVWIATVYALPK